jgi:uncharacterized delta-60 repeat protein
MRIHRYIWVAVVILCCTLPPEAVAYPGELDRYFNFPFGYSLFNGPSFSRDRGVETAVQPDGRILVLGHMNNGANDDVLLLRYSPDGTLDLTFGLGGYAIYDSGGNERGLGLALQPNGKIVVTGYVYAGTHRDVLILRYNANGSLDATFGTGGALTYGAPGRTDIGFGVAHQADGRIVVAGETSNGTDQDLLVLRYNPDGTMDGGFGAGGVFTYGGPGANQDRGFALALQGDGKIVVAGASILNTKDDVLLLRLDTNGALDATFGTGGVVTYTGPGDNPDYGNGVAVQRDGKIVVAGATSKGATFDVLLLRYNANGVLDNTFGTGGVTTWDNGGNRDDYGYGLVVQSNGRIVAAGYTDNGANADVLVLRYDPSGALDRSFGFNGVFGWNGTASGSDYGQGLAIQSDGKLIVVGYSFNGVNDDVLIMRLHGDDPFGDISESLGGGGCFVATAAYGSYLDPHVVILRQFRDNVLLKSGPGKALVRFYYDYSPPLASFIERHEGFRFLARLILAPVVFLIGYPYVMMLVALPAVALVIIGRRKGKGKRSLRP